MFFVVCLLLGAVPAERHKVCFTSQHLFLMLSAQGPSSKWQSASVLLGCIRQVVPSIKVGVGYRSNDPIHIITSFTVLLLIIFIASASQVILL